MPEGGQNGRKLGLLEVDSWEKTEVVRGGKDGMKESLGVEYNGDSD